MTGTSRRFWNAADLEMAVFPEPRWAVAGVLAEGVTLVVGAPKVGKSWLALNLGVAVATGGLAFGRIKVEAGPVLYMALEDTGRRLQRRMHVVMQAEPWPELLDFALVCEPLSGGGDEQVTTWLTRHPTARLLIVDTFQKVRGATRPQEQAYQSDYTEMSRLKAIADAHDVAVVVIHHTRKAQGDDFLDDVSGTQGLAGAADGVVVLKRSRGEADAVLHVTGRDVEEANYALSFAKELGAWQMLDGPVAEMTTTDNRAAVLRHLRQYGSATPKHLADSLSLTHDNAKKLVRRMADAGQIDTDGNGNYLSAAPRLALVSPVPRVPVPPDHQGDRDTGDTPCMSPEESA